MTSPNHALTGAVIGLTVDNPVLALPLAFLSHFVCDAIPHYDPPGEDGPKRFKSKRFVYELIAGAGICFVIVLLLAITRPQHWLTAVCCAFLAASPDLFWIPRFLYARRTNTEKINLNRFLRFHSWVQWKTGPQLIWLELIWFGVSGGILVRYL